MTTESEYELLDAVDAMIFTGGVLHRDPETVKAFVDRWHRSIRELERLLRHTPPLDPEFVKTHSPKHYGDWVLYMDADVDTMSWEELRALCRHLLKEMFKRSSRHSTSDL